MRTIFMAAVIVALEMAAPMAQANAAADAQKALQTVYDERDSAVSRKDITKTLAHYAPDFVGLSSAGKPHDLQQERADFLHTFALPAKSSITKSTLQKLTLSKAGTEADVTVQRHGILLFVNPQTHLNDVLVLDGIFQDVWTKRPAGWLLTREQTASVKATMNGQPL